MNPGQHAYDDQPPYDPWYDEAPVDPDHDDLPGTPPADGSTTRVARLPVPAAGGAPGSAWSWAATSAGTREV